MRVMILRLGTEDHELGPVETRGAMHIVQLTPEGKNLYLANRPDTQLIELRGDELHVRATFVRNHADWRVAGDPPPRVTAEEKRAQGRANVAKREAEEEAKQLAADAPPAPEPSGDEFDGMTKAELKDACEEAGLPTSGNKADLAERLRAQSDPNEAVE